MGAMSDVSVNTEKYAGDDDDCTPYMVNKDRLRGATVAAMEKTTLYLPAEMPRHGCGKTGTRNDYTGYAAKSEPRTLSAIIEGEKAKWLPVWRSDRTKLLLVESQDIPASVAHAEHH